MALLNSSKSAWEPVWLNDPRGMPMGKLPVLETPEGEKIADSEGIREFLKDQIGFDMDSHLSTAQLSQSRILHSHLETYLLFALMAERWMDEDYWRALSALVFQDIPWPIRGIVSKKIRKNFINQACSHGFGKFSASTRARKGIEAISVIENILGNQAYLLGDQPSSIDTIASALLSAIIAAPVATPMREYATKRVELTAYVKRCKAQFGL